MYAKVFSQIYDGTLCTKGPWQALVTFQQLLVLADQDGSVDMTTGAIARRTTIPLEIIELGIGELLKADPESRTPVEDGKRIVPLSEGRTWGWRIVNYKHYRDLKREEDRRAYHREYWHKRKAKESTDSTETQHTQPSQPIAEAKAKAEALKDIEPAALVGGAAVYRVPDCPYKELQDLYHEECPSMARVLVMTAMRQKNLMARWRQVCSEDKMDKASGLDWFRWYFQTAHKSKFLTGCAGGKGDRVWKADFEWLINGSNFAKVVEGRYSNERATT